MWVCLNNAFVSVVRDRNDPRNLLVRARRREHLERLFPGREIVEIPDADYRYRLFVPQEDFTRVVVQRIAAIDYDNFKNSVDDPELHALYERFWELHREYQDHRERRRRRFQWDAGDLEKVDPDNSRDVNEPRT